MNNPNIYYNCVTMPNKPLTRFSMLRTYEFHFVDEFLNLDEFDSGDEIEDPCTNNTERVQDQENESVEARETVGDDLGHANPNHDIYHDISVTEWHFT